MFCKHWHEVDNEGALTIVLSHKRSRPHSSVSKLLQCECGLELNGLSRGCATIWSSNLAQCWSCATRGWSRLPAPQPPTHSHRASRCMHSLRQRGAEQRMSILLVCGQKVSLVKRNFDTRGARTSLHQTKQLQWTAFQHDAFLCYPCGAALFCAKRNLKVEHFCLACSCLSCMRRAV